VRRHDRQPDLFLHRMPAAIRSSVRGAAGREYRRLVARRSAPALWLLLLATVPALAAAPQLVRTRDYEAPVRGGPDDLVMISGTGFSRGDRVVFMAADVGGAHPAQVPSRTDASTGLAAIVHSADPPLAITIRLPPMLTRGRSYRLWVVNAQGEWSEPLLINDPRPQWLSPAYVYATEDLANLGRSLRVVGRNLAGEDGAVTQIRLRGPHEYVLASRPDLPGPAALRGFVAEARLPASLTPGSYSVSLRRAGTAWIDLAQNLEVRPDPPDGPRLSLDAAAFGGCRANVAQDDSPCFTRALLALAHGGTLLIPAGSWNLSTGEGFVLARDVRLRGAGAGESVVVRHDPLSRRNALLRLTGRNSISGITFTEDARFDSPENARAIVQLGGPEHAATASGARDETIEDIVITDNAFRRVGRALADDAAYPIERLFVTRNDFGAYYLAIDLTGSLFDMTRTFRIDDTVLRWNRFSPGSYLDVAAHQGAIASELGAGRRLDFSSNVADGSSTDALQDANDARGFRAAFFWNMNNSVEQMLVSDNRIACSGDKAGDGEAIALDANGDTYGFNGAGTITAAGPDWVAVTEPLLAEQRQHAVPAGTYYLGHWVKVVSGPGLGQTRRIVSYQSDTANARTVLKIAPQWDLVPDAGTGRIVVSRQYWQVFVVGNEIEHGSPPCRNSNRNGANGGVISVWTPSADSVIEANRQHGTNGILFQQGYSVRAGSCPQCDNATALQTALEIWGNTIDGAYDWPSECSEGGIRGSFSASPTPESRPPTVGFGVVIAHNTVVRADGVGGGAIGFRPTWFTGPTPGDWPLIENTLIFQNALRQVSGPVRADCNRKPRSRIGIRLGGTRNLRDTVLYGNRCEEVGTFLEDRGERTARLCADGSTAALASDRCECRSAAP
jgi:hypothetical protein